MWNEGIKNLENKKGKLKLIMEKKFVQNSVVFIHSYVYKKDPGIKGLEADYMGLGDGGLEVEFGSPLVCD